MIDFPASPTLGQQFVAAGVTWIWDGAKWLPSGLTPTVAPGINSNRIINGDMRIDQRNNGVAGTAAGYTADRWQYAATQVSKGTWQRGGPASPAFSGFPYYLLFTSSSAYTPLTADSFAFSQAIEADQMGDFAWGTTAAQPVTLSFWVFCSLGGTFSGAIRNYAANRSYPFSYSLVATTWTKVVVTIPGDTVGAWLFGGNAGGLYVGFDLGSGATLRAPANAWASGNYVGVTGAVSVVATNGATFYVTGVKLEIGSVATPYNRQSLAKSMADCQRYYQQGDRFDMQNGAYIAGVQCFAKANFPVTMRATPTITPLGASGGSNTGALTFSAPNAQGAWASALATATGNWSIIQNYTASAEL